MAGSPGPVPSTPLTGVSPYCEPYRLYLGPSTYSTMSNCAERSTNWRGKSDTWPAPPTDLPRRNYAGAQQQTRSGHADGWQDHPQTDGPGNRKDDDELALKAMAEGRRLYVGNMPYMARIEDVEMLFRGGEYRMQVIHPSPSLSTLPLIHRTANASPSLSIHSRAEIHHTASSS